MSTTQLSLLVESSMLPIPSNVKILNNWGFVRVVDDVGVSLAIGDHVLVEAEQKHIISWLKPFDCVWVTKPGSSPVEQEFVSVSVRL